MIFNERKNDKGHHLQVLQAHAHGGLPFALRGCAGGRWHRVGQHKIQRRAVWAGIQLKLVDEHRDGFGHGLTS